MIQYHILKHFNHDPEKTKDSLLLMIFVYLSRNHSEVVFHIEHCITILQNGLSLSPGYMVENQYSAIYYPSRKLH